MGVLHIRAGVGAHVSRIARTGPSLIARIVPSSLSLPIPVSGEGVFTPAAATEGHRPNRLAVENVGIARATHPFDFDFVFHPAVGGVEGVVGCADRQIFGIVRVREPVVIDQGLARPEVGQVEVVIDIVLPGRGVSEPSDLKVNLGDAGVDRIDHRSASRWNR